MCDKQIEHEVQPCFPLIQTLVAWSQERVLDQMQQSLKLHKVGTISELLMRRLFNCQERTGEVQEELKDANQVQLCLVTTTLCQFELGGSASPEARAS